MARLICALFWYAVPGVFLFAEDTSKIPAAGPALFRWNLLWAGSWEESRSLYNRGDLRLLFPAAGLTLRAEFLDRRPLDLAADPPFNGFIQSFTQEAASGLENYGGGLYHKSTGSRLLYGVLDEGGLSARVRNPWVRGLPLAENHRPSTADMKTAISSTKEPETYLYLGSPRLELFGQNPARAITFRGFASAQIDRDLNPGFGGGFDALFGEKIEVRLDGFSTGKTLPPRKSASWFSESPPLPERDFRLYALGLLLDTPVLTLSSDWAFSETFAWGRDLYGSLGLRVARSLPPGRGRWVLSLAADGAGSRYVGRDGSIPGAGFRSGGKFEWYGKRSSLLRFGTTLRSPGFGAAFDQYTSNLSWRFPVPGRNSAGLFRFTRASLETDRDASDPARMLDGLDLNLGFSLNPGVFWDANSRPGKTRVFFSSPVGFSLSGALKGTAAAEDGPAPYPVPQSSYEFDSVKAAGELQWSPGIFQFRVKLGWGVKSNKDEVWETTASAGVRFKRGRLSVKVSSPDFPDTWNYTVSWQIEKK
jgi:hypothetical protein